MFTGLIEALGTLYALDNQGQETRLRVRCDFDMRTILLGDSIAVSGVCLTVTEKNASAQQAGTFAVQVSAETRSRTTFATLSVGATLNLERALAFGGRLNGHLVQGHVDGIGRVVRILPRGGSLEVGFRVPATIGHYVMTKGSIAIDGVSLTVNEVMDDGEGTLFSVNIIPHTRQKTTLADLAVGQTVNIETDLLSRTVERLLTRRTGRAPAPRAGMDEAYLRNRGFY